jgi:DNA repair protein RadA/Sms
MAVFSMESQGLVEVDSPSTLFLADRDTDSQGAALGVWLEGSRPIGIEVEALVTAAQYGSPQRQAVGWPKSRLMLASAVLEKRCHLRLGGLDVFVNVSGGVDLSDPGFDLAVYAALLSSARNVSIGPEWAFIGEVSLLGGIRRVHQVARRVELAQRLGATRIVVPASSGLEGKHVLPISDLAQLWRLLEPAHVETVRTGPERPTRPVGAPARRSGRSEIRSRRRMAGAEMGDLPLPD